MKIKRYCFRCKGQVKRETDKNLKKTYPYYCPRCDENMFTFETYKKKIKKEV